MKKTFIAAGALTIVAMAAGVGMTKQSAVSPEINYASAGLNQQESMLSREYIAAIQTTFPDAYGSPLLSAGVCMGKSLASNLPESDAKILRQMAIASVKTAKQPWPAARASLTSILPSNSDRQI